MNQVKGWFAEQLAKHREIPIERRGEYGRAAGVIFERMTPTALLRLAQNVREIRFFPDLESLTVALVRSSSSVAERLSQGRPIGGAYTRNSRRLYLDGGDDDVEDGDIFALYSHEFAHAVNGPLREISNLAAWQEAWRAEIVARELSILAATDPHEGFAELGRFMYSGMIERRFLEQQYPKCVEVWKGRGIW